MLPTSYRPLTDNAICCVSTGKYKQQDFRLQTHSEWTITQGLSKNLKLIWRIAILQKHQMPSQYFPKSYKHSGGNVKIELNLSNYASSPIWKEQKALIYLRWHQKHSWLALKLRQITCMQINCVDKDFSWWLK